MVDRYQRVLRDLRISVTDRCNFRCRYCMPQEVFGPGFQFLERAELLSFEEIARLASVSAGLGVRKLRLTGGEPLLRRDLDRLIAMLASIEGIDDIALTTNGSLLAARAESLVAAGLSRVTVSLDALDDATFAQMNGVGASVDRVLAGIDAAAAAGLAPVKVNMVVKRGVNDDAVLDMASYFRERGHVLRFIEYMDVGNTNQWHTDEVVSAADLRSLIGARWPLEPLAPLYPGEVARRWRYADGSGEVGFIASVTEPFCGGCTRARVSADGQLYTCLFGAHGHDLRSLLRDGSDDSAVSSALARIWGLREDRYSELRAAASVAGPKVEMSYIGG
ncbi:MAG: GTP 3',8-cyclase MoaA [Solirubrobacterales bacterium]|nr:GTP 3',8-cyclase MoaA [Solirubrobacterales bacterium]